MTPLFNVTFGIVVDINASLASYASHAPLATLTIAARRYVAARHARLLHRLAAVDDQRVTDGEGASIRAQPEDGTGDLFGPTHPPGPTLTADTASR